MYIPKDFDRTSLSIEHRKRELEKFLEVMKYLKENFPEYIKEDYKFLEI